MDILGCLGLLMIIGIILLFVTPIGWVILSILIPVFIVYCFHLGAEEEKKYRYKELRRHWDQVGKGSEDRIAVCRNGLWGFVNLKHQVVIKPAWKHVHEYKNGFVCVENEDGLTTYLNKNGEPMMAPIRVKYARDFEDGVAEMRVEKAMNPKDGVEYEDFCAFLNTKGNLILLYNVESIGLWHDGYAEITHKVRGVGVINTDGEFIGSERVWKSVTVSSDDLIVLIGFDDRMFTYSKSKQRMVQ